MFKLYNVGVTGKTWSLINNCHQNTISSVVVNQTQLECFCQSRCQARRGPFCIFVSCIYLLNELETCSKNTGVLNITSSCPFLADDIVCIRLSPTGL
jgi:hypothetical protein